jgi:hypothetical protein
MDDYHVNLGADAVPSAAKRRFRYRLMLLYFLFCGLLLMEGGYRVTAGLMELRAIRTEQAGINRSFKERYPGKSSLKSYAAELKKELEVLDKTMGSLKKNLPEPVPALELLAALLEESPPYTDILTFDMSADNETVSWRARVALVDNDEVNASKLVRQWRSSELINSYVKDVTMVDLDERKFVKGVPAIEISCRASLKKGGK